VHLPGGIRLRARAVEREREQERCEQSAQYRITAFHRLLRFVGIVTCRVDRLAVR
jgi:hypothetical protein